MIATPSGIKEIPPTQKAGEGKNEEVSPKCGVG